MLVGNGLANTLSHWRRLVKDSGVKPKFEDENVLKADKCMGVCRFIGRGRRGRVRAAPKVCTYALIAYSPDK